MNKTEIIDRLTAIDAALYERYDNPVTDGIVDAELYFSASPKVMWILKEANSPEGDDWDMKAAIKALKTPTGVAKGWGHTFHKIIYTMNGIFNDENYEDMQYVWNNPDMIDVLNRIAFINIKKVAGGANANDRNLADFYEKDKDLILEQINLCNPDVIICGSTFEHIKEDLAQLQPLGEKVDNGIIHYYATKNRIVIDAYHPNARVKEEEYSDSIINAVWNWRQENGKK